MYIMNRSTQRSERKEEKGGWEKVFIPTIRQLQSLQYLWKPLSSLRGFITT